MKSIANYIAEKMFMKFSKSEIEQIKQDMKSNDGEFKSFIADKIYGDTNNNKMYADYLQQCIDDDRCLAEFMNYISDVIGRNNFSVDDVRTLIDDELYDVFVK